MLNPFHNTLRLAHGAAVMGIPGAGPPGGCITYYAPGPGRLSSTSRCLADQGAAVMGFPGAGEPGGCVNQSGGALRMGSLVPSWLVVVQGADVRVGRAESVGGCVVEGGEDADGAFMLGSSGLVVELERCCFVCTVGARVSALGSASHRNRPPKGKCWTTGNFARTSA